MFPLLIIFNDYAIQIMNFEIFHGVSVRPKFHFSIFSKIVILVKILSVFWILKYRLIIDRFLSRLNKTDHYFPLNETATIRASIQTSIVFESKNL